MSIISMDVFRLMPRFKQYLAKPSVCNIQRAWDGIRVRSVIIADAAHPQPKVAVRVASIDGAIDQS